MSDKLFGLVYGDLFAIAAEPLETDLSVDKGKKCIVASDTDIGAGMDLGSALADKDIAGKNDLAVGALIFFCYNDYRTHIGDKGTGVLKQRVHGVVDVYGARKASFEALTEESSPIESVTVVPEGSGVSARVRARKTVPSYRMQYALRWIVYGEGAIPLEQREVPVELAPGEERTVKLEWIERTARRVQIEVRRPTGFVAAAFTYAAG
jgi:beta-glucuronidase